MFLRLLLILLLVALFIMVFVIPMAKRRIVSEDRNQMYFKGNHDPLAELLSARGITSLGALAPREDPRTLPPNELAMRIGARLEHVMDEQERISYGLE